MTVYTSNLITDRENKSAQIPRGEQGHARVALATYEATGVIANNDIIVLAEIPASARIVSIKLYSDDLGTAGDFNFGFYAGNANVSTLTDADAIDEDAIGTAVDLNAAALNGTELRFETKDLSTLADPAWSLAGLSAAPAYGTLLFCATASEATTAAGGIAVVVTYTE